MKKSIQRFSIGEEVIALVRFHYISEPKMGKIAQVIANFHFFMKKLYQCKCLYLNLSEYYDDP